MLIITAVHKKQFITSLAPMSLKGSTKTGIFKIFVNIHFTREKMFKRPLQKDLLMNAVFAQIVNFQKTLQAIINA